MRAQSQFSNISQRIRLFAYFQTHHTKSISTENIFSYKSSLLDYAFLIGLVHPLLNQNNMSHSTRSEECMQKTFTYYTVPLRIKLRGTSPIAPRRVWRYVERRWKGPTAHKATWDIPHSSTTRVALCGATVERSHCA